MGMWDALEQGTPVLEALGNMFLDLAKQIAAAAIKAAVFATILNFIPGLGGAASAGGFGGIFNLVLEMIARCFSSCSLSLEHDRQKHTVARPSRAEPNAERKRQI
jgi:hypothetical protein